MTQTQDRIQIRASKVITELEYALDRGESFSAYGMLLLAGISPRVSLMVIDHYQPIIDEFRQVMRGDDPSLSKRMPVILRLKWLSASVGI